MAFRLDATTLTPALSQGERGQRKPPLPLGEGWGEGKRGTPIF